MWSLNCYYFVDSDHLLWQPLMLQVLSLILKGGVWSKKGLTGGAWQILTDAYSDFWIPKRQEQHQNIRKNFCLITNWEMDEIWTMWGGKMIGGESNIHEMRSKLEWKTSNNNLMGSMFEIGKQWKIKTQQIKQPIWKGEDIWRWQVMIKSSDQQLTWKNSKNIFFGHCEAFNGYLTLCH